MLYIYSMNIWVRWIWGVPWFWDTHMYMCYIWYTHIRIDSLGRVRYDAWHLQVVCVWQDGEHRSLSASASEARCGMSEVFFWECHLAVRHHVVLNWCDINLYIIHIYHIYDMYYIYTVYISHIIYIYRLCRNALWLWFSENYMVSTASRD